MYDEQFLSIPICLSMKIIFNYNIHQCHCVYLLSFEWNSIRLGGHAHEIVTKTVHKTLPGGGRGGGGGWLAVQGVVGV